MRMADSVTSAKGRAAEALKAVLHQVSQIKVKDMDFESHHADLRVDILAHLDVHGHSHTLVCKVEASGRPEHVRIALEEFQEHPSRLDGDSTMVFIAPRLSEEAKTMCRQSKTGFLDLEGNARLELGEVFIGKQSLPQVRARSAAPVSVRGSERLIGVA